LCIIASTLGLKQETFMCGIVGILDKRGGQYPLGKTVLAMLGALGCRGPDSAGVALFGPPARRWLLQVKLPEDSAAADAVLQRLEHPKGKTPFVQWERKGSYIRLQADADILRTADAAEEFVLGEGYGVEVVSVGHRLEIIKQVGSPAELERAFAISGKEGSHGIGHTRLSTESRVDLSHSQPFWAHGIPDLATVHNGHITNYHKLRRRYEQRGYRFYTENDSEVIGVYLRDRMRAGMSLQDALRSSLDDFDGSFSYLAAWADGLAYVRDRFGFKPLILAETDEFVALATEEIALRQALGDGFAAREPVPGTVRVWPVKQEVHLGSARVEA
jgi:glutamate synthase domain-containing protein 1